ncbi:aldo/keto reductase [Lachnospiraceae bacterium ZAX-1]
MLTGKIKCKDGELTLSRIILGAGRFGSATPLDLSYEMLDKYYEAGGRTLDTGRAYMAWVHNGASKSEKTVGDWIRDRGVKDMSIVTKCAHPELRDMNKSRLSPDCLSYDINTSLAVLRVDSVDCLLLHRDDTAVPVGEIMDTLDQFINEGLVRSIGASNWSIARICEANEYAKKHGKTPFTISQIQWNMAENQQENLLDPTCLCMTDKEYEGYLKANISVMAYSSQAVGFFSKFLSGNVESMRPRTKVYVTPENIRRAKRVEQICAQLSCTPEALCIAYITSNPVDGYAVIANSSMKQMEESLAAADFTIDQETMDSITKFN